MTQKLSLDDLLLFDTLSKPKTDNANLAQSSNSDGSANTKSFSGNALDQLFPNQVTTSSHSIVANTSNGLDGLSGFNNLGLSSSLAANQSLSTTDSQSNQVSLNDNNDNTHDLGEEDEEDDFGDFVGDDDFKTAVPSAKETKSMASNIFPSTTTPVAQIGPEKTTNFSTALKEPDTNTQFTFSPNLNISPQIKLVSDSKPQESPIVVPVIELKKQESVVNASPRANNKENEDDDEESFGDFGDFQGNESFGDFIESKPFDKPVEPIQPSNLDLDNAIASFDLFSISQNDPFSTSKKQSSVKPSAEKDLPSLPQNTNPKPLIPELDDITLLYSSKKETASPNVIDSETSSRPVYGIQASINEFNTHDHSKPLGFGAHVETTSNNYSPLDSKRILKTNETNGNVVSGDWNNILSARSGPGSGKVDSDAIAKAEQASNKKHQEQNAPPKKPKVHALVKSHKGPENLSSKLVYNKKLPNLPDSNLEDSNSQDETKNNNDWDFDMLTSSPKDSPKEQHKGKHSKNKSLGMEFGLSTSPVSSNGNRNDGKELDIFETKSTVPSSSNNAALIDIFSSPAPESNPTTPIQNPSPSISLASLASKTYIPSSPPASSHASVISLPIVDMHPKSSAQIPLSLTSALATDFPKATEQLATKNTRKLQTKKVIAKKKKEEEDEAEDWGDFQDFSVSSSPISPKPEKTHQLVSSSNLIHTPTALDSHTSLTPASVPSSPLAPTHKKIGSSGGSRLVLGTSKPKISSALSSVVPSDYNDIPSSIELLQQFNSTVLHIADSLFSSLVPLNYTLKKRVLANPKTKEFLLGYLETVMVCAKIMAGRRRRLTNGNISNLLSEADGIPLSQAKDKQGNVQDTVLDILVEKSDREARESERIWSQEIAPRLRAANVAALVLGSSSNGSPTLKSASTFKDPSSDSKTSFAKSDQKRYKHLSILAETGIQAGYLVNGGVLEKELYKVQNNEDGVDKSGSHCIVCGLEPWEEINYLSLVATKKKGIFGFAKSSHRHSKSGSQGFNNATAGMEYRWTNDGLGHATCLKFWENKATFGL